MRLPCPYCGERDVAEFVCRGEALSIRPDPDMSDAAATFHDYLYLRDNPAGQLSEHWHHVAGCRNWLVVRRDTRTHAIIGARLARAAAS